MDCKLALLLLSITATSLAFECLEDGAYRDSEDCSMYWVCDQTGVFHMPCPDGLYFNEGEGVCDYPENVLECPFECKEDGMFMDRADCAKYYWCVGEQQYHMDCPDELWFNNAEQGCDWPENVDECPMDLPTSAPTTAAPTTAAPTTAAPTTPEPTTPVPTTPVPTTPVPTTPVPTTPVPTTPVPTTPVPTTPEPTTPEPTTGSTTAAPTTMAPTTPGPTPEPFECPGDGFYMASTCVDYWRCLGDRKWIMPCPDGLWFNTGEEACDWPENVPECSMDPPTYPPTTAAPTTVTATPTTAAPTTAAPEPTTKEPTYPPTTSPPTYPTEEPTTPEPTTPEPTTPEPTTEPITPDVDTPEPTTPEPTTPEPTTPGPTPFPTTPPGPTDDSVCKDEWEDCDYESMCDEPELVDIYCRQTCGKC